MCLLCRSEKLEVQRCVVFVSVAVTGVGHVWALRKETEITL